MSNKVTRIFRQIIVIICCLSIVLPSCNLDIPNNTKKGTNNFNSKGFRSCVPMSEPIQYRYTGLRKIPHMSADGTEDYCKKRTDSYERVDNLYQANISGQYMTLFINQANLNQVITIPPSLFGSYTFSINQGNLIGSATVTLSPGTSSVTGTVTEQLSYTFTCNPTKTETIKISTTYNLSGSNQFRENYQYTCNNIQSSSPTPTPHKGCEGSSLFLKLNPMQEIVSPKDGDGVNDTIEFRVKGGCDAGKIRIDGVKSAIDSDQEGEPPVPCYWEASAGGNTESIVSWNGKCSDGDYMANGKYFAHFTLELGGPSGNLPVEVKNGATCDGQEKFLTPREISDGLHANSLNFLAPDNKTFSAKSFNEEYTHRSINELIDKQNEIKVLDGKISSLSARNLSTSSLLAQKAIVVSQRDALKQEIITGLESHKNKLRTSVNSLLEDPDYSSDSTTDKPTTLQEYKDYLYYSDEGFIYSSTYNNTYSLLESLTVLADENKLLKELINDYTSNTLIDIVYPSNTIFHDDIDKLTKPSEVIKYLSEQISRHQDKFNASFSQLNDYIEQELVELNKEQEATRANIKFMLLAYLYSQGFLDISTKSIKVPSFSIQQETFPIFNTPEEQKAFGEAFGDPFVYIGNLPAISQGRIDRMIIDAYGLNKEKWNNNIYPDPLTKNILRSEMERFLSEHGQPLKMKDFALFYGTGKVLELGVGGVLKLSSNLYPKLIKQFPFLKGKVKPEKTTSKPAENITEACSGTPRKCPPGGQIAVPPIPPGLIGSYVGKFGRGKIVYNLKSMQKKIKHAKHLGSALNDNKINREIFKERLENFLDQSDNVVLPNGMYLSNVAGSHTLVYNPISRNMVVIENATNSYLTNELLTDKQFFYVSIYGKLGGH